MLNKAIVMGRLVKDPELRYTASNIPVCNYTIAVNRPFSKDKEQADFINVVTWRSTAEFNSKYFKKGMQVAVSGRLQTRTWDDENGKKHFVTELVANETYFADSKRDNSNSNFNTQTSNNTADDIDGFMPIEADDDLPF